MYYMVKEITEGQADDTVAIPELKQGFYFIRVTPKPGTSLTDTFSLEVRLPDRTIVLADQVPISDIPRVGYGISFTGSEVVPFTPISIDIKPGSDPNSINPRSRGVITVAILTTEDFDATTVDPLSVAFGPNGATETHNRGHIEDVDGDGDNDLVLHFNTQETGIQCGDTEASLTGETVDGTPIEGADAIVTVGC
jgi:hypothetical protein